MALIAYLAWATAAALKFSTVARMSWNGLVKKYPWVAVFLGVCATRSLALMCVHGDRRLYRTVYTMTLPFGLLAEGAAILVIFWAVAVNYPKFRTFGSILLTILGIGGAMAAWAVYATAIPHGTVRDAILLLQQSSSIFMVVVLAGSQIALPRSNRIPIPKVAQRAAGIFLLEVVSGFFSAYIGLRFGLQHPAMANTLPLVADVLVALLWLVVMTAAEVPSASISRRGLPAASPGDLGFQR